LSEAPWGRGHGRFDIRFESEAGGDEVVPKDGGEAVTFAAKRNGLDGRAEIERPQLLEELLSRIDAGPLLFTGPPGAGKTTNLFRLRARLADLGWLPIYLDFMGAASSPERFVASALEVLPAGPFAEHLPRAMEIRRLSTQGKANAGAAVKALLSFWSEVDAVSGKPVALLFDEATEIRSLAYFAGLRDIAMDFGVAMESRRRGTVLATSFPTLARRLWSFKTFGLDPLSATDLAQITGLPESQVEALLRCTFGWPRHVRVLLETLAAGRDLVSGWALEMSEGGRMEIACRHTYESLLLRSRGYGMSKAVLASVADEEGLNLTALVERLGRTPGAVRDYLQWLVAVDALKMTNKRYYYVDGMVRLWVRLHARGTPPGPDQLREAALEAIGKDRPLAQEPKEGGAPTEPLLRRDSLMEID